MGWDGRVCAAALLCHILCSVRMSCAQTCSQTCARERVMGRRCCKGTGRDAGAELQDARVRAAGDVWKLASWGHSLARGPCGPHRTWVIGNCRGEHHGRVSQAGHLCLWPAVG